MIYLTISISDYCRKLQCYLFYTVKELKILKRGLQFELFFVTEVFLVGCVCTIPNSGVLRPLASPSGSQCLQPRLNDILPLSL